MSCQRRSETPAVHARLNATGMSIRARCVTSLVLARCSSLYCLPPYLPLPHPRHSKLQSVIIASARRDGLAFVLFEVVLALGVSRHKARLIYSNHAGFD